MRKLTEEQLQKERERLLGMRRYEDAAYEAGARYVLGVDEVGRGPLCGPVVAAACILPRDCEILFLNDSKKLSEKRRALLFDEIREKADAFALGSAGAQRIDEINILNATFEAMREAVAACLSEAGLLSLSEEAPERFLILVDGNRAIPGLSLPQKTIVKGDGNSLSIAAASVLAKVTRDRQMEALEAQYPGYGFAKNKGYGTKEHYAGLAVLGATPIHRRSFLKPGDLLASAPERNA